MKTFQQARGSNSLVTMGFESALATAATSGVGIKFNNMTLTRSRDLNASGTIQPGRSPVEPFQGNGDVNGEITVPNDLNQLFYFLKAAFGAPTTTSDTLEKSISAIMEATTGYVQVNVGENHGFNQGDTVTISGVTAYNGTYTVKNVMEQAIIIQHAYVDPGTISASAKVTRSSKYTHVFTIGNEQPSVTIEKLFGDIAEKEVYLGCKVSSLDFKADASGQENTVTCGFVGCKPQAITNAIAISSIAVSSGTATVTTATAHGLSAGDIFVIAGSGKQILDGKHSVVAASTTTLTFTTTAANGTYTYSTAAEQPALLKSQFTTITNVPLARLGTFSASIKKDNVTYNCAKEFNISFNMGIDTDQRCIGDNGYLSSLPEGTVEISTTLTALFRSAELQKIAANNDTVAWELKYESNAGSLTIELPENKVQEAGVPIESAMGLSQSLTVQAFCSTAESGGSAATITLVNDVAA